MLVALGDHHLTQPSRLELLHEGKAQEQRDTDHIGTGLCVQPGRERRPAGIGEVVGPGVAGPGLIAAHQPACGHRREFAIDLAARHRPEVAELLLRLLRQRVAGVRPVAQQPKQGGGRGVDLHLVPP